MKKLWARFVDRLLYSRLAKYQVVLYVHGDVSINCPLLSALEYSKRGGMFDHAKLDGETFELYRLNITA